MKMISTFKAKMFFLFREFWSLKNKCLLCIIGIGKSTARVPTIWTAYIGECFRILTTYITACIHNSFLRLFLCIWVFFLCVSEAFACLVSWGQKGIRSLWLWLLGLEEQPCSSLGCLYPNNLFLVYIILMGLVIKE